MEYIDAQTRQKAVAYIFVAVLPASNYPFVYAYSNMKTPNWIDAHVKMYSFFNGVPLFTISDNCKTAVVKSDRIDPVLNKSYHEMAQHYGTTLMPARAYRPKDKGADENMVGIVSRKILAALRNQLFFSLQEVNHALRQELLKLIEKPFQKMEGSRKTAYETIDKPCLKPLPTQAYEYADWMEARIGFHYHVEYEKFFYSVHFTYADQYCSIRATNSTIEIYIDSERIAAHKRNYNKYKRYSTCEEHMPEAHKAVYAWTPERFLDWAGKVGPYTRELIQKILESRDYPVQSYRACQGVMRLAKSAPTSIMESASCEALTGNTLSFKYFNIILKKHLAKPVEVPSEKVVEHGNIRGSKAYMGGGNHA